MKKNQAPLQDSVRRYMFMQIQSDIGCPTTSLSKLFSMQHRLPGWPQASAGLREKKTVKGNVPSDPSSNAMNYVKFTVVMAACSRRS